MHNSVEEHKKGQSDVPFHAHVAASFERIQAFFSEEYRKLILIAVAKTKLILIGFAKTKLVLIGVAKTRLVLIAVGKTKLILIGVAENGFVPYSGLFSTNFQNVSKVQISRRSHCVRMQFSKEYKHFSENI